MTFFFRHITTTEIRFNFLTQNLRHGTHRHSSRHSDCRRRLPLRSLHSPAALPRAIRQTQHLSQVKTTDFLSPPRVDLISMQSSSSLISNSSTFIAVAVGTITLVALLYKYIFRAPSPAKSTPATSAQQDAPAVAAANTAAPPSHKAAPAAADAVAERLLVSVKNSMTACCLSCDCCTLATASDVRRAIVFH